MRILVVSDSHGNTEALERAVDRQSAAELIVHLGDGDRDAEILRYELPPQKALAAVKGNNDWRSDDPTERVFEEHGVRIMMMHGHTYAVKQGLGGAIAAAKRAGARILLYGHTHKAFTDCVDGLYIMNPGAVGSPYNGTYGTIDLTPHGIRMAIHPLYE